MIACPGASGLEMAPGLGSGFVRFAFFDIDFGSTEASVLYSIVYLKL